MFSENLFVFCYLPPDYHCHHRGHHNQISKPSQLKKCYDFTYCALKDKHPEYFSKLNQDIQELENHAKAMEDFSQMNIILSKTSLHIWMQWILPIEQTSLNSCRIFDFCKVLLMDKFHQ